MPGSTPCASLCTPTPRSPRWPARPGQRRHRARSPSRAASTRRPRRRRRAGPRVARRPGRHRAGGAAGGRGGRRRPGRRASPASARPRQAAQLEGSKAFAKDVMAAAGVPTAAARPCRRPGRGWRRRSTSSAPPYVVKDDGLAAGKGVRRHRRPRGRARPRPRGAGRAARGADRGVPRRPGGVAVRASPTARRSCRCVPAQDFKRRDDGDGGPNTGGMGAYAPLPWAPAGPGRRGRCHRRCSRRSTRWRRRGKPFSGLLYAGLALTSRGRAGGRVQRPLRRSGDPGRAAAAGDAAGRAAARGRHRHARRRTRRCAGATARRSPSSSPRRATRSTPRTGDAVTGADAEGVLHAGTAVGRRRRGRLGRWAGAVGDRGRATTSPPPGRPPTSGSPGSRLAGAHWRTDIALAAVEGRIALRVA